MRLPRMTTRQWMIAVAAAGTIVGMMVVAGREQNRAQHCLRLAELHRQRAELAGNRARFATESAIMGKQWIEEPGLTPSDRAETRNEIDRYREASARFALEANYHGSMVRKYLDAANRSWMPALPEPRVATSPPPPPPPAPPPVTYYRRAPG